MIFQTLFRTAVFTLVTSAASTAFAQETVLPARFGDIGHYADRYEARFGVMAYDRGAPSPPMTIPAL
jgi:hypothetical protein